MEPWLLGAIAGGTAALAVVIAQRRGDKSALPVLPILRRKGPLTIPELMTELGVQGFSGQGKVVMAIDALVRSGHVIERPVPAGTATLDRIHVRKYAATA